jgi:hypothetical protein
MNHSKRAHKEHRTMPPPYTPLPRYIHHLTVRFLVARASTWTAELLGLAPSVIGDEQCAVVLDEGLLKLVLGVLVDVFLVVGDDGFGDGLADGIDLRGVTSAGDAHADIDVGWSLGVSTTIPVSLFPVAYAYRTCPFRESGWARRP